MGLMDFFTPEAGQDRRRWLDSQEAALAEALRYYLGPTGIPERLGVANEMLNPVVGLQRSAAATNRALDPSLGGVDRVAAGADAATEALGALLGVSGLRAATEAAAPAVRGLLDDIVERANQPGVMPTTYSNPILGLRLYHGSPHDFDRFDMSKIGTGEGAQAYGHGLYFAESEPIARFYRDALSSNKFSYDNVRPDKEAVQKFSGLLADIQQRKTGLVDEDGFISLDASADDLAALSAEEDKVRNMMVMDTINRNPHLQYGRMYEVQVNANPDDFLDWDKPLSEQPQVLDRLRNYGGQYRDEVAKLKAERDALAAQAPAPSMTNDFDALFADDGFGEGWARLGELDAKIREAEAAAAKASKQGALFSDSLNEDFLTSTLGRNLATASGDSYSLTGAADNVQLSQQLREAGIPGIRYLDAGSRGAGDGSRNYVVFDDKLIDIVRKYGIAGAAVMLGVSAFDVEQAMAQGQQQPQGLLSTGVR